MSARRKGSMSHLLNGPWEEGLQTHSMSLEIASLCLVEGPLHPDGRIYLLVFHGPGVSHHYLADKIVGASSERPSEPLLNLRIIFPFHDIC